MKFGRLAKAADTSRKVLNLYDHYLTHRDRAAEAHWIDYIAHKNEERDRVGTWSASSSGNCLRQQQFVFLGMPKKKFTPEQLNIFYNGDFVHLRYQVAGLIDGWLTDVEVPLSYGTVRGTADGLLSSGEVLEVKSINTRGFEQVAEYGAKEDHKLQATAYMLSTGRSMTRFVYENKNTNANIEHPFEIDQIYVNRVQAQWAELNALSAQRKLAPRLPDCINERGFDWNYCPFTQICEKAKWPKPFLRVVSGSVSSGTSPSPIPDTSSSVSGSVM